MDTLKCLQNGNWFSFGQHYLILEECNITEANQAWQCIEGTKINFKLQKSKRYMLYRRDSDYILGAIPFDNLPDIIWQRFQSGENLCSQGRLRTCISTKYKMIQYCRPGIQANV